MGDELSLAKNNYRIASATEPQESIASCGFFVSGQRVSFRSMVPADLDEVMAIERTAFRHPWSAKFFSGGASSCLRSVDPGTDQR